MGTVQGVGFRPFVHSLAKLHQLTGFVRNNSGVVEIEVQGTALSLSKFVNDLKVQAPPLSEVNNVEVKDLAAISECEFEIKESTANSNAPLVICPDCATCTDCVKELFDKNDRRYRYPFINCTSCGPRFTIIESLPYDREQTTMRRFVMCSECQNEYDNPSSRRFHAQPNACAKCGPTLIFKNARNTIKGDSALAETVTQLKDGQIIAIKGIGGFHLVCDAENSEAVRLLRQRKRRRFKPFALMMRDLEMVGQHCFVNDEEAIALTSSIHPIVLLQGRPQSTISDVVAPGSDIVGVMLPYTPLHHLLTADFQRPLVATSGNQRNEPIAIDNDEAHSRLSELADCWLENDRDIHIRFDDSIVYINDGKHSVLRRARGMAPRPIPLPPFFQTPTTILALGGQLKNTFCFVKDGLAYLSQHIGDLEVIEAQEHFEATLETFKKLFHLEPQVIACDLHPDYRSTHIAQTIASNSNLPIVPVQHHHAHVAACMVEHNLQTDVIGVVFDGLGLGLDGTLWGGEFFIANPKTFRRVGHFKPCAMPGGTSAIKNPWRMTLGYLFSDESKRVPEQFAPFIQEVKSNHGASVINNLAKQVKAGINSPYTSSCGRLFDACSALLGVCHHNEYEGQCAIELEVQARRYFDRTGIEFDKLPWYEFEVTGELPFLIDPLSILKAVCDDMQAGTSTEEVAARFHITIARTVAHICIQLHDRFKIGKVCLSGGVFQNRVLLSATKLLLTHEKLDVFVNHEIPINDGGLSLGQAVVAAASVVDYKNKKQEVMR